ncbi:hypothetical protein CRI94_00460 [Longibacter salinarum]|uniref:Secretion system C-terminal sorting domain-containing protein n=1 Tax=Longibacter salinarum TaxID=1850348 RepID=A0A2A8D1G2_9BACT|nr:T9SS type A sorting domain-containing protein [Longibacter salinarum]PEN14802.1 hypothetical protein CRI94_00460 [Longibacter salinarum]
MMNFLDTPLSRLLGALSFVILLGLGWWIGSELYDSDAPSEERAVHEGFWPGGEAPHTPDAYPSPSPSGELKPVEAGIGAEDDPIARARFDWMRLRDPSTGRIPKGIRAAELSFAETLPKDWSKSLSWNKRGPFNIGGRTRALAYDISDPTYQTILAAGVSGGIWRTTDGGTSWSRVTDPDQRPSITSLTQDTRTGKTDIWYASTGERRGNSAGGGAGAFYRGDGVYKSTDGGLTWSILPSTDGESTQFDSVFDYTWRVRTDPSNATQDEVYVAAANSIVRSTDGGATWSAVLGGSAVFPEMEITSTGVVYATLSQSTNNSGLYRSPDGVNWTNITPADFPAIEAQRTTIGVNPSNEDEVWFLTYAPGSGPAGDDGSGPAIDHELWMYDAGDGSWTDHSDLLPTRGDGQVGSVGGASGDFNTQNGYDIFVKVHPADGGTVFAGGRNLWRIDTTATAGSADSWIGGYTQTNISFATYEPSGSDPHHPDQHGAIFQPDDPSVMITASDGGVHRTTDNMVSGDGNVVYESLNNGYFSTQFYHVCSNADPTDPTVMGGMQDNGTWFTQTSDPTADWTEQLGGDGANCAIANAATRPGTARYPSLQNGQLTRWDYDENGTLTSAVFVYPTSASGILFVHPFELDPVKRNVMYYPGGTSMWRTENAESTSGIVWDELSNAALAGHVITALDASEADSAHVLYYGTVDPNGGQGRVYRLAAADTVQSAADADDVTDAAFPTGGYVSDIAVDPADSDRVLVAFSNYNVTSLFFTEDGGQTWTDVEGNLAGTSLGGGLNTGPSIRSVAILPQPELSQTTFYVGTSVGLYSTSSLSGGTTSWTQEGPNSIGTVVVDDVDARAADGQILVGTHANGVYSSSAPLPVELAEFTATVTDQDVELTWQTTSETNNAYFQIDHRAGDAPFQKLHTTPGAGTSSDPQSYRYRVTDLGAGSHDFRLQQVDVDGSVNLNATRTVEVTLSQPFVLTSPAPNPVADKSRMSLTVQESQPVKVHVYNTLGQRVQTLFDGEVRANTPVDLTLEADNLSSGAYFVRVEGRSFTTTRKATVVR